MRIALLPLDSRPANWQFPQRLAELAGVELRLPPRELLGTLHCPAQQAALLDWLLTAAIECDAAVFSYDALVYGGLVQSRRADLPLLPAAAIGATLARVDWSCCAGYALATVPRLGLSVTDRTSHNVHQLVREYLIAHGAAPSDPRAAATVVRIEDELGRGIIEAVWRWRERNAAVAGELLELSCGLGLRQLHFAVEDNAATGPHLAEAAALRKQAALLRREHPATNVTLFDGTDEALCLLLARAVLDQRRASSMPVQLLLHPRAPGPDQYTGLYESQPLSAGLDFLARQLGFEYSHAAGVRWLVAYGVQPQPDLFSADPARVFNNPFLLPKGIDPGGPLLLTDLCACNGANPNLAVQVAQHLAQQRSGLLGLCGFNTNFNALGVSAAWLSLCRGGSATRPAGSQTQPYAVETGGAVAAATQASRRFALERLADDVVYQSIARPRLQAYLRQRGASMLDFSRAPAEIHDEAVRLVQRYWRDWHTGPQGAAVLDAIGIEQGQAESVRFSFPWQRAFECEAAAPLCG
jgi:hypothetical protein